jgi:hypothetical protein
MTFADVLWPIAQALVGLAFLFGAAAVVIRAAAKVV